MASSLQKSVSNRIVIVRNTPAVQATPDYSTGDLIGGKQELINAVEESGAAGIIRGITVADAANQKIQIDAIFFNADPSNTTFTENGALAVNAADLDKIIGAVVVGTYFAFNANAFGQPSGAVRIPFVLGGGTSLFLALIARGTINLAATTDLDVRVALERS